jgi:hypothetical protein
LLTQFCAKPPNQPLRSAAFSAVAQCCLSPAQKCARRDSGERAEDSVAISICYGIFYPHVGGPGSTRWGERRKARLVEDSLAIDLIRLNRAGFLDTSGRTDQVTWTRAGKPLATGLIGLLVDEPTHRALAVCIALAGRAELLSAHLRLVAMHPHFGGARWFLVCPDCERRVLKLYVSSKGDRIGCRKCLGLTYRSAQEHDARVDLARRDPEGFSQARENLTSLRSRMISCRLAEKALAAMAAPRRGRGWERKDHESVRATAGWNSANT